MYVFVNIMKILLMQLMLYIKLNQPSLTIPTLNIVCDIATDECWFDKCSTSMNGNLFKKGISPLLEDEESLSNYDSESSETSGSSDDTKLVKWYQWQNVTVNDK